MKTKAKILLILPALLLLFACTPEKKLARDFVNMPKKIRLQVFPPELVFKYNHKGEKIEDFKKMNEQQQDSALYFGSDFIQYVSDSIYLERYINNFLDETRKLGFEVFLDNQTDTFLQDQQQAYVLNMAQVQLDEYTYPHKDSETIYDTVYSKTFNLNGVDASSWFELSKVNSSKKTVLYSTFTASDAFDGGFYIDPFTSAIHYKYNIDSLHVRDIYDLATYAGRRQADYLFDYFMNNYVTLHMPPGTAPSGYLRYDRYDKSIYITDDERFEVLDK
ncbi:MAG: hypothetical protein ACM3N9_04980 [Syntrophothermus sp.]